LTIRSGFRAGGRAIVTLDAGDVHRPNQQLYIKEFQAHDDGVIGSAVFDEFIVELDFHMPAVRLHSPASFRYGDHSAPIPCDLWSRNPHIAVLLTIDDHGPVQARLTVDSGAAGKADALLTPRFNDQLRRLARNIPWTPDKDGWSICRIARLAVGPFATENPLIALPPVQGFGGAAVAAQAQQN
jgi:hypothetical protein